MENEDLLRIVIGLVSAFVGWMLAQITSLITAYVKRHRIKRLLIEELKDLDVESDRLLSFYKRQLQLHGAGGIGHHGTQGLANFVFKNYYKDALLGLNQHQRISFQMIHGFVDTVNSGATEFGEITKKIQSEHLQAAKAFDFGKASKQWAEHIKAQHAMCSTLKWMVRFHLNNRKAPDLTPGTSHHSIHAIS